MSKKDVVMGYETLFEILRLEKMREELQKLEPDFFKQVLRYLCQKQQHFESKQSQTLLFERDEKEKARLELENVRKILKDLYDRREKKILHMALNKSRSGISLVNLSAMLPSEQALFNSINSTLSDFREETLFKLVAGKLPCSIKAQPVSPNMPQTSPSPSPSVSPDENSISNPASEESDGSIHGHFQESKELKAPSFLNEKAETTQKVKFMAPVEEIIGPDLQIYGPYESGAIIELPKELAAAFVKKEQAEEV
ncbi:hypothetical protein ACFL0V_07445 [Nanoarchaeota archaeon]